jgi:hypothetical protein
MMESDRLKSSPFIFLQTPADQMHNVSYENACCCRCRDVVVPDRLGNNNTFADCVRTTGGHSS